MVHVRQRGGTYCPLDVARSERRDSRQAHHPHAVAALIPRVLAFRVEGTRRHRRQLVAAILAGGFMRHWMIKYLGMKLKESVRLRTKGLEP